MRWEGRPGHEPPRIGFREIEAGLEAGRLEAKLALRLLELLLRVREFDSSLIEIDGTVGIGRSHCLGSGDRELEVSHEALVDHPAVRVLEELEVVVGKIVDDPYYVALEVQFGLFQIQPCFFEVVP